MLFFFFSIAVVYLCYIAFKVRKIPVHILRQNSPSAPKIILSKTRIDRVNAFHDLVKELKEDLPKGCSYEQHAGFISRLISSDLIPVDELTRKNFQAVFDVTREIAFDLDDALDVRFAVQFNLFGGSVANLGDDEQLEWLRTVWNNGEIGAFLLTEQGAGVLSGLIVETTATYTPEGNFVFNSPVPVKNSKKFWISQGLTAKWGVVIATLLLPGKGGNLENKGPHAFVIDLELDGVCKEDMKRKTDFNSLDNAVVWFDNVVAPRSSLLRKISYIDEDGVYHLKDPNVPYDFVNSVAQNLMVGRVGIAGGSLSKLKHIIRCVEEYADHRDIPVGKNSTLPLSQMPFMRDLLTEIKSVLRVYQEFSLKLEKDFMNIELIDDALVNRISCAKIEITTFCIDSIQRIKKCVGSYSLQEESPFGSKNDILYVYAFAEGDVSILQQKMTRDSMKKFRSISDLVKGLASIPATLFKNRNGLGIQRAKLQLDILRLAFTMGGAKRRATRDDPSPITETWLQSHELVTQIARRSALLTMLIDVEEIEGTLEYEIFKRYIVNQI